jgi:hypothetical protein
MGTQWGIILLLLFESLAVLAPLEAHAAAAGQPVAILTEVKAGQGDVRVKPGGEADWKVPLPLMSLRPGDQVQATGNAKAVLMFAGGQGAITVSPANSPYTIQALPGTVGQGKLQALIADIGRMLAGKKKDLTYVPLAVRNVKHPPLLLAPRDGKLLEPPTLEWAGSDRLRYTVRILGPQGVVWEQANLPKAALPYPASAPRLSPGVPYRWELETRDFEVQQGRFVILPAAEAAQVRDTLSALNPRALPGYPRNTVILMRAVYLFERGLYGEAGKELQAAIAADADEPTLHLMLGHVHERVGLLELAAEEFDEAQFLVSSSGTREKP